MGLRIDRNFGPKIMGCSHCYCSSLGLKTIGELPSSSH
jgi:hypothetical protein